MSLLQGTPWPWQVHAPTEIALRRGNTKRRHYRLRLDHCLVDAMDPRKHSAPWLSLRSRYLGSTRLRVAAGPPLATIVKKFYRRPSVPRNHLCIRHNKLFQWKIFSTLCDYVDNPHCKLSDPSQAERLSDPSDTSDDLRNGAVFFRHLRGLPR